MAGTTTAAILNTPISKLRSAPIKRVVAAESDDALLKAMKELFSAEGNEVGVAPDGEADPENLATFGVPLVIVRAGSKLADKVLLVEVGDDEMGGDDCVASAFSLADLIARMGVVVRGASHACSEDIYVFDDVMVDFSETEINRRGKKIVVTPKEFQTLAFLIKNAKRVVSREELLNEVWGYQNYPCTRTVDNHILRLRRKLERDPSRPLHLVTVHCLGYKFVP
jgi:DNA-binding response OmpR family regulator